MSAINSFLSQRVAEQLGWTLVHFVWQGAVVAMALMIMLWSMRRRSPQARYAVACAALMLMAIAPVVTAGIVVWRTQGLSPGDVAAPLVADEDLGAVIFGSSPTPGPAAAADFPTTGAEAASQRARRVAQSAPSYLDRAQVWFAPKVPWAALAWCVGVCVLSLQNLTGWLMVQRLKRCRIQPVADHVRRICSGLCRRLSLDRPIRLMESALANAPAVVGWLRPVILLPASTIVGLAPEELASVLAHELAHVRRYDYLVNLFQTAVETVLFYHPAVWWASRRIRIERENICDDAALAVCGDRILYARALTRLEELRVEPSQLAVAADGTSVVVRIRRLLGVPASRPNRSAGWSVGVILVAAVFAAVAVGSLKTARAQSMAQPPGERVVYFPENRSLGTLYVREWGQPLYGEWDTLGEARGAVTVPNGMELYLDVAESAVPDLSPLGYLGEADLQGISFMRTSVRDIDLQYLVGMTTLREVALTDTSVGNQALFFLQGMNTIERLNLRRTQVNDDGLAFISDMTNMRHLILNLTSVTDEGISYLQDMTQMEYLDLWRVDISDERMVYLAGMTQMRELGLEDTQITDAGLAYLVGMTHLEDLNLENNDITDAGLAYLASLTALRDLNLMDTQITDEGMRYLAELMALRQLYLPIQIGPDGLAYFEGRDIAGWHGEEGARGPLAATGGTKKVVRVVDATSGRSVRAPRLELVFTRPEEPDFLVGDDSGEAVFYLKSWLEESSLRVTASADGYLPTQTVWDSPIPDELLVELVRGAAMGGVVLNESGNPIGDVSVALPMPGEHDWASQGSPDYEGNLDYAVLTDAEGRWRCDAAPANLDGFWVRLNHPDYAEITYGPDQLSLAALRNESQVLVMGRGLVLAGWVVDQHNAPIPSARVAEYASYVRFRRTEFQPTARASETDQEGRFEMSDCDPGMMVLKIQAAGFTPVVHDVTVAEGLDELVFTLTSAQVIRGRVVHPDGTPVEGVSVSAAQEDRPGLTVASWRSVTDAQGRFVWHEAPQDPMEYRFFKRGYDPLNKELAPDAREHQITLQPQFQLSGRVLDAATGEPIQTFTLLTGVSSGDGGVPRWFSRGQQINENGEYAAQFHSISGGKLVVGIEAVGYLPAVSPAFESDRGKQVYDFRLEKGAPLKGTVLLAGGAPAAAAQVALATPSKRVIIRNGAFPEDPEMDRVETDDHGRFEVAPQPPPFTIVALHEQGVALLTDEEFAESTDVVLDPWGRVEGNVLIGTQPAADSGVALEPERRQTLGDPRIQLDYRARTNAQGEFIIEKVVPGEVWVHREIKLTPDTTGYSHGVPVEVQPGQTARVTLGGTGRPVVGRMTAPKEMLDKISWAHSHGFLRLKLGDPRPAGLDEMSPEQHQPWWEQWSASEEGKAYRRSQRDYSFPVSSDGTFRIDDIPAGAYSLRGNAHEAPAPGRLSPGARRVGSVSHEFEVPEMPEGRSDEPLNIGTLEATPAVAERHL